MSITATASPKASNKFPVKEIESSIRDFLAHEGAMQAVLHGKSTTGAGSGSIGPQPVIDSLVVVEVLIELEALVPFALPDSLVRAGGYDSVDEVVQHLLPKVERRWTEHQKEKS